MDDHTSSMVTIRDCGIRLMRGGKGSPLLFLHGASGAGTWLPFLSTLATRFDVLAPEHPGFGASETPAWLDTIADLANFYLDLLDQFDLGGVHLVGHSLGGWIAAELAVRNSSRLASLTLVAAGGIHVDGVTQVDVFLSSDEQRVRDMFYDQRLAEGLLPLALRAEADDAGLKNRATTAKLTWHPRNHDPQLQKWLHRIEIPTLLIWGEHDRLIPKEYAYAYQRLILGAEVVIIPDCGHVPQIEQEHALTGAIESFTRAMRFAA
jgi:pimeloyl-ACP methyl ester carboxylesterase